MRETSLTEGEALFANQREATWARVSKSLPGQYELAEDKSEFLKELADYVDNYSESQIASIQGRVSAYEDFLDNIRRRRS